MDSNSNQTPNTWQSSSIILLSSDQIKIRPPGVFMKEQGLTLEENAGEPSKPSRKQKLKEKKLRKKLDELKGLTDMLFLIIVAVLLLCLLAYYDTKKPKNFPPGPKWWPILGSAPQIASIQKRTNHFVYATSELAKKYGPILGLKVGTEVIVIVNGYAANKEFLLSEDLSGRPIGEFFDKRTWGKRRESVGESFSEDQLVATCMDMFMAGSETTSNTLSFAVLYLILYPEVQKKAQAEIDYVIGKCRTPCLADRPRMPYLECVVLESLRMFGGRAFTVPHRALRDTYLCGYRIPKDVLVIANLYGCMLEEGCEYDNPDVFKPERFLENGKIFLPDSFIPFGIGKHRCLGESLARANVFIFLAVLLQNFDLNICPEHPPTTEWIDGVTPGPKPFKARITPRKI